MRKISWRRILPALLTVCLLASYIAAVVPAVYAERVTIGEGDTAYQLEYFPVTLFDYDDVKMNASTRAVDGETVYNGLYFSTGSPEFESESVADMSAYVAGQYYIQNIRASENKVGSWLKGSDTGISSVSDQSDATEWTLSIEDGSYYLYYTSGSDTYYLAIGDETSNVTTTKTAIALSAFSGNGNGAQISDAGKTYFLCQWGSTTSTSYGGYDVNNDGGNGMYFYRVNEDESQTLTTPGEVTTTIVSGYAPWNRWDKGYGNEAGQKTWTGLVASQLDANKNIVFNVPDAGIFSSDAVDGKTIYQNVKLPFYYEADTNTYIFDSHSYGVYFAEDDEQGTSATPSSNSKLFFDQDSVQAHQGMAGAYGDGSVDMWAPFNSSTSFALADVNYYFGMNATIPFTMTTDGKMTATNEDGTKDDIVFNFSGDDDVWIFVDGYLVADLGGIHNRLDVSINFATNTVTYSESNDIDVATGSYNDEDFALEQVLFGNLIPQDRTTFAATDSHELTIFYLERGAGSSNTKIWLILPVKDNVTVQKIVDEQIMVDANGNATKTDLSSLTEAQLAVLNNLDFGFTMYKDGEPLANATYNLLNANGQVIANPSTDANGHFTLKNGQTAKFVGEFATAGNDYYVVEDVVNGFIGTDFSATSSLSGDSFVTTNSNLASHTYYELTEDKLYYVTKSHVIQSPTYTVKGDADTEDSLAIVCENYMNASLPRPSALPNDDKVVIDFGLPVTIDLFSNDLYLAETYAITFPENAAEDGVYTAKYGTFTFDAVTNSITYTLTKQLTGVEVISYTLTGTADTATAVGTANVYIIPATTMYYEENFGELVIFRSGTSSTWVPEGSADTDNQEPGVVGTVGDSPYGSDNAYLNDSGDSNGTSMYVDTTNSAAQFEYTFTGTGTSFFVRTTNNSGYIRVVVTDAEGNTVALMYRDTLYANTEPAILYNIPTFTWDAVDSGLEYGTYTVTVTIAKKTITHTRDEDGNLGPAVTLYHSDFWLDGIRVYQPLDPNDTNAATANAAYAADGEANMVNVTLRDKLLGEAGFDDDGNIVWNDDDFVLFTDSNGAMVNASDYESIGPKEEVYLNNGQSVTFALYDWDPNTNKIYLGIKAPGGTGTVSIGSATLQINNATDCYYDITSYGVVTTDEEGIKTVTFTITAGEGSLISVTNMKITGSVQFDNAIMGKDIDVPGDEYTDVTVE